MFGIVLFHTSSAAMKAEKALGRAGLSVRLVPTPRQFSSDCGFALRFDWAEAGGVAALLAEAGVEVEGIHQVQ
ncbi:MAG: hypothetical protein K0R39_2291 [Symbiobacteriaceae bacterium]|jgi:hypothetical protein|nr:hypothetical protein [Symbiobacteriaceae bacterium]